EAVPDAPPRGYPPLGSGADRVLACKRFREQRSSRMPAQGEVERAGMQLDGGLFFPVTPFTPDGEAAEDVLAEHVKHGVAAGPGGVFVACGTGEFHALEPEEFERTVRVAVDATAGRVPVFAGAGGSVPLARKFAAAAERAGADGILLLPPYLVG